MRGWQWIKCQCAHATSCSDQPRGNWVVHWIQPGDSWLINWSSHSSRTLQAVGLPSSVSTRDRSDGDRDCYKSMDTLILIDRTLGPKTTSHLVHQSSLSRDTLSETEPIVTWPFTFGWSLEKSYSVLAILWRYAPWRGDTPFQYIRALNKWRW